MKKTFFLFLANLIIISAIAQNSNVNKANTLKGQGKLAEAKELIDAAVEHDKTKEKSRTWFIRGTIYTDIASSEDEAVRAIDEDAVQKAVDSYNMVKTLVKEGTTDYTLSDVQLNSLWNTILLQAAANYENEEFMAAYDNFNKLTIIEPTDTLGYMYAGAAAEAGDESDMALEMFFKTMELENCPATVYSQTASILEQNGRLEEGLEVVTNAMERYPDDQNFDKTQISLYIQLERTEEAVVALEDALEAEPENANLWYNLGYLYGETGDYEKSINGYKNSIEADPNYLDSYINLAYTYSQKAKKINQVALDMDYNTFAKEGAAIEAEANVYYALAVPILEKANEVNPDDRAILESLNGLYIRLKMNDKSEIIYNRLVELGFIDEEY